MVLLVIFWFLFLSIIANLNFPCVLYKYFLTIILTFSLSLEPLQKSINNDHHILFFKKYNNGISVVKHLVLELLVVPNFEDVRLIVFINDLLANVEVGYFLGRICLHLLGQSSVQK